MKRTRPPVYKSPSTALLLLQAVWIFLVAEPLHAAQQIFRADPDGGTHPVLTCTAGGSDVGDDAEAAGGTVSTCFGDVQEYLVYMEDVDGLGDQGPYTNVTIRVRVRGAGDLESGADHIALQVVNDSAGYGSGPFARYLKSSYSWEQDSFAINPISTSAWTYNDLVTLGFGFFTWDDDVSGLEVEVDAVEVIADYGTDTTPPAPMQIEIGDYWSTYIDVDYIDTGDDGNIGVPTSYDWRVSTSPITPANFSSASTLGGGGADNCKNLVPAGAGVANWCRVKALLNNTQYYIAVKVTDEQGNTSAMSNVISAITSTVDNTPPAVITDLRAVEVDTNQITLMWTAPGDDGNTGTAGTYYLKQSGSPIITNTHFNSATSIVTGPPSQSGSNDSVSITGLSANTTYYFAIKTEDIDANMSERSDTLSVTTSSVAGDTIPPAGITDLNASGTSNTQVELNWSAPGDDGNAGIATSYDIRFSTSPITNMIDFLSATPTTSTLNPTAPGEIETLAIDGLTGGSTYYFAITSSDEEDNQSVLSNVAQVTLENEFPDLTDPGLITDLTTGNRTNTTIELLWTAVGDNGSVGTVSYYEIRYDTTNISNLTQYNNAIVATQFIVPLAPGEIESFEMTGLIENQQYYFAVVAYDENDNPVTPTILSGNTTDGITANGADTTPPGPVPTVSTSVTNITSNSATISWTAVGDDGTTGRADRYDVRISPIEINPGNFGSRIQLTDEPTPNIAGQTDSMDLTGLALNTTYYVVVSAIDEAGNQSIIPAPPANYNITFTTLNTPIPSAPVITTNGGSDFSQTDPSFTMSGNCSTNTTSIEVNGSTAGVNISACPGTWSYSSADASSPLIEGSNPFAVVAKNSIGDSSASDTITVTYAPSTKATLSISNAGYNYGDVTVGQGADFTFTVSYSGDFYATEVTESALSGDFDFKDGSYPGTGGTCDTIIFDDCTMVVTYTPSSAGSTGSTIQLVYDDGTGSDNDSISISGTGQDPAQIDISDSDPYDFGTVLVGDDTERSFVFTNNGDVNATSLSFSGVTGAFRYKDGSFPGTGGNCGTSLNAGANCNIVVEYAPSASGNHSSTIQVDYNDGLNTTDSTRDIEGDAEDPASLTISESNPHDFGDIVIGSASDHTFTISNTGDVSATSLAVNGLAAPFTFKDGSYPGTGGDCNTSLAASDSCDIVLTYTPTADITSNDTINVDFHDGLSVQNITRTIEGAGLNPADLSITESNPYDYGDVVIGNDDDHTFTITNDGDVAATSLVVNGLAAPFTFKDGSYPGTGGDCNTTLAASDSCDIVVTYAASAASVQNDTIEISWDDGIATKNISRNVQGTGRDPANLTINGSEPQNYGSVVISNEADFTFQITNNGDVSATSLDVTGLAGPFDFKDGSYPGTGGNCNTSISAGGNCTIVVTYTASTDSLESDSILVDYDDGVTGQQITRGVEGTGLNPADLSITESDPYDFGDTLIGDSTEHTFTVSNSGDVAATSLIINGLSVPFNFKGGGYPGTGGDCGSSIPASDSCDIVLTYTPSVTTTASDTIDISYNDGTGTQNIDRDIEGSGLEPAELSITESNPYNYGDVVIGDSEDHTFTITNNGDVAATSLVVNGVAAPFTFKDGSYPGTDGDCGTTLAASDSCDIVITYAASADSVQNDTINISWHDGDTTQNTSRNIQGTGKDPASLSINGSEPQDYGSVVVGNSADFMFQINNSGDVAADSLSVTGIDPPFTFKDGSYPGTGGNCNTSIAAYGNCTIVVTYTASADSVQADTINIDYDDGVTSQQITRGVQGTGLDPANLSITESDPYDYGDVLIGSSADHTFTISNSGDVAANSLIINGISTPYTFKDGAYPGTGGDCGSSIAASDSCDIVVTYTPTATSNQTDTINISYNDGTGTENLDRDIEGSGLDPADLSISESNPYNYGNVVIGNSAEHTFTITNNGDVAATSLVINGIAAPFAFKDGSYPGTGGDCNTSLAASDTCTIVITYAATADSVQNDVIDVAWNDGVSGQSTNRQIQGTGRDPANLAISASEPYDYGNVVVGNSADFTFMISNSGDVSADSLVVSGLGGSFGFKDGSYPGTGGNCNTSIPAYGNCNIVVTYTPVDDSNHTDTIVVDYHDDVAAQQVTRGIEGTGQDLPVLTISESDTFDFGPANVSSTLEHTFTISNIGDIQANSVNEVGIGGPFDYKDGTYPGTGGDCGTTLAGNDSCTLVLTFTPGSVNTFNDAIQINYHDTVSGQSVSRLIQGTGQQTAIIAISGGTPVDFGSTIIGDPSELTITLTNTGSLDATSIVYSGLSGDFDYKDGSFPGTGGDCNGTIADGDSCDIVIVHTPSSAGLDSVSFQLDFNDGVGSQTTNRTLQGTGLNPASLSISESNGFDFGDVTVGNSTDHSFTISNTGDVAASSLLETTISGEYDYKDGSYPGTGGDCNTSIAGLDSCTIVITYTPSGSGTDGATITFNYNDGQTGQLVTRTVQATGLTVANLSLSESSPFDYPDTINTNTVSHVFTLSNTGETDATSLSEVTLTNGFDWTGGTYPGTAGDCGTTLVAGDDCDIDVEVTPGSAGLASSTLQVDYDDGVTTQSASKTIRIVGLDPALLSISESDPYDYGSVALNSVASHAYTVTNDGDVNATSISESVLSAPFSYKDGSYPGTGGDCGAALNAGDSCTIVVDYEPTGTGTLGETLQLDYNDGLASTSSSRTMQGTGVNAGFLTLSESPTYSYPDTLQGSTVDLILTVTNTGQLTTSSLVFSALNAPFTYKDGSFPGTGGDCNTSLVAADDCTVVLTFSPGSSGAYSDTLEIDYYNGQSNETASLDIDGAGLGPAIVSVSESDGYDFGATLVGNTIEKTFTVTNSGDIDATSFAEVALSAPFTYKGGSYPGTGGDCGTTLNSSDQCDVVIEFTPGSQSTFNSSLQFDFYDGFSSQSIIRTFSGTGALDATLTISESDPYDYGAHGLGVATAHTFIVSNTGGMSATAIDIQIGGDKFRFTDGVSPGTGGDCGVIIPASGSCTIEIEFVPTNVSILNDIIDIDYHNGTTTANVQRQLTGEGLTNQAPQLSSISTSTTNVTAGTNFQASWTDSDNENDFFSIDIYYKDSNSGTCSSGTIITSDIDGSQDAGSDQYSIDTSTIEPGNYYLCFQYQDSYNTGAVFSTSTFTIDNRDPNIFSDPVLTATELQNYSYDVYAIDSDVGTSLTYTLSIYPDGMRINSTTGAISYIPDAGTSGTYPVTVIAADNHGGQAMQSFSVEVIAVADWDGDGISNTTEQEWGLDPLDSSDAEEDFDGDGLSNLVEYQLGSNGTSVDSDGDGLTDKQEVDMNLSPGDDTDVVTVKASSGGGCGKQAGAAVHLPGPTNSWLTLFDFLTHPFTLVILLAYLRRRFTFRHA